LRRRNEAGGPVADIRGMKRNPQPTADLTMDEVMRRWPATIRVCLDFKFNCVGCPIASFHSVEDACREHHVDPTIFLPRLCAAV
jgi:hybrid cluster-associated redox disulfide protein